MITRWQVSLLVTLRWIVPTDETACPPDFFGYYWFGSDCQYKCHCKNAVACNVTNGDCPNGCDIGWFGPACQYADVLQNASIQSNDVSSGGITLLTDANDETCFRPTNSIFSLKFVLLESNVFTWLRLVHIGSGENLTINFKETTDEKSPQMFCNSRQTSTVNEKILDVYCNVQKSVQQIIINGSTSGTLCSFYVSGGRNVALRQTTNQTTDYSENSRSVKAVDGNVSQNFDLNSCSCTKIFDITPTWFLNFRSPTKVVRYKIYNRLDCCQWRLKDFQLNAYDMTNKRVFSYVDQSPVQSVYSITPVNVTDTMTVQITLVTPGIDVYLTLCEVQIYGDTTCGQDATNNHTYGRDCENVCNCEVEAEKCFVSTGNCPSGCKAGYFGEGCHRVCKPTYYGVDCQQKCSSKCEGQLCHASTGQCISCSEVGKQLPLCEHDCLPGYYGNNCTMSCHQNCDTSGQICSVTSGHCLKCKYGFYGDNCTSSCPANCQDPSCELTTGSCIRCKPGFYGNTCSSICPVNCMSACDYNTGECLDCKRGFYGANCSKPCSSKCIGGTCTADTGQCEKCLAGYYGTRCEEVCLNGTYGEGCGDQCSTNCKVETDSSPCHPVSGVCLFGCLNSYTDYKCLGESSSDDKRGQYIGIGVGIGIGASCVIAGIIAVMVYIVVRRRQKPPDTTEAPKTYDHIEQRQSYGAKYHEETKSYTNDYRTGDKFKGSHNSTKNVNKTETYENLEMNPYESLNDV